MLKFCGISLCPSGCNFTTAYWFAMKLCTEDLEGFFYYLKLNFKLKFLLSAVFFFRVFITKFCKLFYRCLNFSNMADQDEIRHQN